MIAASNLTGMIHGCGLFLRGCQFPFVRESFIPNGETVTIEPYAPYRGVYMASHFQTASTWPRLKR